MDFIAASAIVISLQAKKNFARDFPITLTLTDEFSDFRGPECSKNKVKRIEITNKIKLTHTHKIKFTLILVFPACRGIIRTYSYRIMCFWSSLPLGVLFSVLYLVFPVFRGIICAYSYRLLYYSEFRTVYMFCIFGLKI